MGGGGAGPLGTDALLHVVTLGTALRSRRKGHSVTALSQGSPAGERTREESWMQAVGLT